MGNSIKRFLSLALAIVMILSIIPTNARADEPDVPADETTQAPVENAEQTSETGDEATGEENIELVAETTNVAKVGDTEYATLADAITAAQAGDTITFLADITEDVTVNKAVTIDGAGKTYTGAMTLKADTTIKNVNFDGKGYNGYAITTRGANYLTIEGCTAKNYGYGFVQLASATVLTTVKNVTVSNMNYGVKVDYSNAVVLEGVDIDASVAAVLNSNYGEKTVTIKDSNLNIYGTWTRDNTTKTKIVFEGSNTIDRFIHDEAIDTFKLADDATLTTPADIKVVDKDGNEVVRKDGKYTTVEEVTYVAQIGETGYATLAEAIAVGGNITLLTDVVLDAPLVVTGTVTLELAGKKVTFDSTVQGEAMITNKGTLTINDSVGTGEIYYNYTGAADPSYGKGNYTISNAGTLTVNGGKIHIANLRQHAKYPIDNNSTTGNAVLVINGGHLYNYNTSAIRQFCNSTTYTNSVTINGGLVEGYCAVWVQNPGSKTVNGSLSVTGGEIKTTAAAYVNGTPLKDVSSAIYFTVAGEGGAWSEGSAISITGGTINENVYLEEDAPAAITIGEGATFNGYVELPMVPVAKIGTQGYETLKAAVEAANAMESATIVLNDNVTLGEKLTISGNVTISGAYTITRADTHTGTLFVVNAGATLTLDGGLTIDGNNNYAFDNDAYWTDVTSRVKVEKANSNKWFTPEAGKPVASAFMITTTGGTINLNNVTIQNNYSLSSGVISAGANSTITLTGAKITHVASINGNGVVANVNGKNINVTVNEGTVIDSNHVGSNHGLFLIYSGAKVTMNGGEITNNTGWNSNGTVAGLYSGSFYMKGGTICSNSSVNGPNNGRNAAIYGHNAHTFVMTGGTICHNGGGYGGLDAPYSNGKTEIHGGAIINNISYSGNAYPDINAASQLLITGGTFTQDVSAWLAPDTGLVYNEETGTYTTTEVVWELYFRDPETNEQLDYVGPLQGSDPAYLVSLGKLFYADYYVMELKLLSNTKVDAPVVVDFPMTINLNGHTITGVNSIYPVFRIQDDAQVTVTGNGKIKNGDYVFVLGASDGSSAGYLTIENGTYLGNITVASVTKGTLTINGGNFAADPYEGSYDYTLNCVDANYRDGSAKIVVNGGVFYKFNPADNAAEGANTSFCSENYLVDEKTEGYFTVREANFVASVNGVKYESLQAAINACLVGDNTITLLADCDEDVTISQTEGVNIIIDGAGKTYAYSGTIIIDGNSRNNGAETLTFRDIKFVTSENGHYFIDANSSASADRYAHNVRIDNCEFRAEGDAVHTAAAIRIRQGFNIYVYACAYNMHSLFQGYGCTGLTFSACSTFDCKNGISVGTSTNVSLTAVSIFRSTGYGIRADGNAASDMTMNACSFFTVAKPIVIRNMTGTYNLTGIACSFDENCGEYAIIFTEGADDTTIEPTGSFTHTGFADGYKIYPTSEYVAKVGEKSYMSLQEAVNVGGTVTLLKDIALSESVVNTNTVTLDLNGKTITGTDNNTSGNFYLINNNKGNLTITDSVGGGKITLTATNERNWSASSVVVANNLGTVTVKAGTIEHLGGTSMAYGIDNLTNGANSVATLNVEGGKVASSYFAIRQFANGGTNNLNITGGEISYAWMQSPNANANVANISVTGGTVEGICLSGNNAVVTLEVAANTTGEVYGTAPAGMVIVGSPETGFGLTKAVAQIGSTSYASLTAAFAAAEDGDTITLLSDIATSESITNTKKVTLDLNGKTITGTDNATGSFGLITNKSELTITGNGTMTLVATNNRGWNAYSSVISNTVGGKLIVESGTIEHLGGTDMAYAIDNLTNGKGTYAETVINGGTIKSTYRAIRQFLNGVEAQNILTVNGGIITGTNKSIWMQDPSKNANTGTLTVGANAQLNGDVYLFVTAGSTEWPVSVSIATAALTNGSTVLTGNVPEGYVVEETNGTYSVIKQTKVIITVVDATMVAGNKLPEFTYTYNSTVEIPGLTVELSTAADGKTAGEFEITADVTAPTDSKYVFEIVNGKLTVEAAMVRVYARNNANAKYFTSLKEAIEFAVAEKGNVPVYLLGNVTLTETIVVNDTNAGLVELQGDQTGNRTYTLTSTHSGEMFRLEKGTLSVKNLKINAQGDAFYVTGGILNLNYHSQGKQFIEVTSQTGNCVYIRGGSVNVNGAKLTALGKYPAIQGNGNYAGNVTINKWNIGDGTYPEISAPNATIAIYWPQNGKLTIEGGKITGKTALYAKSGTIAINGGEFIATGEKVDFKHNSNGAYATGDAVVIEGCLDAAYETPKVAITGGTFTSANADAVKYYACDADANAVEVMNISGGRYSTPVAEAYCAEGYIPNREPDEDGFYHVKEGSYILRNLTTGQGYETVYEALYEVGYCVKDGETIALLADIDLANLTPVLLDNSYNTYFKVEGKSITFDLNGKKIFGNYAGDKMLVGVFSTDNNGHLTLVDSSKDKTGTVNITAISTVYALIANYEEGCSITINGGSYILDKAHDSLIYSGSSASANEGITVNGGNFHLDNVGTGTNGKPWIFNVLGSNDRHVDVHGGTFNYNVANQYWAHEVDIVDAKGNLSYVIDNRNGTWTVTGQTAEAAIMVDVAGNYDYPVGYETLAAALAAAKPGQPVLLMKDIELEKSVAITGNRNVVIDLNGHTLSSAKAHVVTCYYSKTTITIKDSVGGGEVRTDGNGKHAFVVQSNLVIDGAKISSTKNGNAIVAQTSNANVTIQNDAVINGKVVVKAGKLTITDGIFNNKLEITAGVKVAISGGYFKYPVEEAWCADGYVPTVQLDNGYYSVTKGVARIGTEYYETLQDAITAAKKDNDTIVLVKSINLTAEDFGEKYDGYNTFFNISGKTITIDLNGKAITADVSEASIDAFILGVFCTTNDGHLTLTGNGTVKGVSGTQEQAYLEASKGNKDYNYKFYSLIVTYDNDCSITINGGNYELDYAGDSLAYTSCNEGIVVNGGIFKLGNLGGIRNGMPWVFNARGQNIRHVVVNGGTFCADIQHQYYPFEVEVPKEKALKLENGMYTVVNAVAYTVEPTWSGGWYYNEVGYATLEEAIAACKGPQTRSNKTSEPGKVVLLQDITLAVNSTIVIDKTVAIDLNGKTIYGENTRTATHNFLIDVKGGTLTASNGTIAMKHTGTNMGWNGATTVIDVTAGGVLNLESVTVQNQGGTDMNFAVHMNNWGEVTLNADNCVFDATYCGVRVFNSGYDMNNVKITNSELTGATRAFWVHNYIGDLDSSKHSAEAINARLNLDIFDNNNTFKITGTAKSPIRYGFGVTVYFDADGDQVQ